jgi:hypothetical protein
VFDAAIPADPIGWLTGQLSSLEDLVAGKVDGVEQFAADAAALRSEAPHIGAAVSTTLERVRAGELAREPVAGG